MAGLFARLLVRLDLIFAFYGVVLCNAIFCFN